MDLLVIGANVARTCWGGIAVVWLVVAIREARIPRPPRIRGSTEPGIVVLAMVTVAAIMLVGRSLLAPFAVEVPWIRAIGVGVIVGSTLFAVWARIALGTSWSVGPRAPSDGGLRTDGPYRITRHPIYTGLLGMLIGSALIGGLGQWIALVAAGLVVAELKIRSEERLLLTTFPDAYRAYRERVPRLVPGWRLPRCDRGGQK